MNVYRFMLISISATFLSLPLTAQQATWEILRAQGANYHVIKEAFERDHGPKLGAFNPDFERETGQNAPLFLPLEHINDKNKSLPGEIR